MKSSKELKIALKSTNIVHLVVALNLRYAENLFMNADAMIS